MGIERSHFRRRRLGHHPESWGELWRRVLLGPPIPTRAQAETRLPKLLALPIFSSDAISSVAYATQEILLALGAAGLATQAHRAVYGEYTWGVTGAICVLLAMVAASYRQTIFAYPSGGGSYIVSRANLGTGASLIAAAALLIDYVLTVAVSVASGVQNLLATPALSVLSGHRVAVCLVFVGLLTLINLRGLRQSGKVFALPTYLFIGLSYLMIGLGMVGPLLGWHLHEGAVNQALPPDYAAAPATAVGLFVVLRAFANGCSAMTGTEAISNGIPAFRKPESKNAAATLLWMAFLLGSLFLGISWLATRFHVVYWEQVGQSAPAVIDQLSGAVFGREGRWVGLYYSMQFATAGILVLAANTSFADFPRLASILAGDGFLPRQLTNRGDRLVFSNGIMLLGLFAGLLLIGFHASVDRLIPLYALGVFTAFTLSQSGMVRHWLRERGTGWGLKAAVNGLGASATAVVFGVILVEKAPQGAWTVVVVAVVLVATFRAIHRRYEWLMRALDLQGETPSLNPPGRNIVLVLVRGADRAIVPALRYARLLADDFRVLYVAIDPERTPALEAKWRQEFPRVRLVILDSPYRSLVEPVLDYVDQVRKEGADDLVTLVMPEFYTDHWWDAFLHNASTPMLKLALRSREGVVIVNVRYHLSGAPADGTRATGEALEKEGRGRG
jgi:amino acid transporter